MGLFRVSGVGLGNLLFAWARSIVLARQYCLTPIWPTWTQLKLGPILRGEKDKRIYHDLFSSPPDYIHGLEKLYLLTKLERIAEDEIDKGFLQNVDPKKSIIIEFAGMQGYFSRILTDHEIVHFELLRMTRGRHKTAWNRSLGKIIAVHVRLGDFAVSADSASLRKGASNFRIPIAWYVEKIEQIRKLTGQDMPVCVFSDGTDEELSSLLLLANVKRVSFGSSIADLLAMSHSSILVTSGSTFSMWASYLGRMPVIWFPGEMRQKLYYEPDLLEVESGKGEELPMQFLRNFMATHQ